MKAARHHSYDIAASFQIHETVTPQRVEKIANIEFVKGPDDTAPVVMAVTVEAPEPRP